MRSRGVPNLYWSFRTYTRAQIEHGCSLKGARRFTASFRTRGGQTWTRDEEEIILEMRKEGKMPEEMLTRLPHRSISAIENRLYGPLKADLAERGSTFRHYTRISEDDVERIRALRAQRVPWRDILEKFPGKYYQNMLEHLKFLVKGEHYSRHRKRYEGWEDELLLRFREDEELRWPEIQQQLSHRTAKSIWTRYRKLVPGKKDRVRIPRAGSYTPTEVATIVELRNKGLPWAAIARVLGKPRGHALKIRYLREKYFSTRKPKRSPWTKAEDSTLVKLRERGGLEWIEKAVKALDRTPEAINFRDWSLKTKAAQELSDQPTAGTASRKKARRTAR